MRGQDAQPAPLPGDPRSSRSGRKEYANPCTICIARATSVCNVVGEADLARLAAAAVVKKVAKGQVFIRQGDLATDFYNITRGTVKLARLLPDGRQHVLGFPSAGHFLGLGSQGAYAFSAEALEPVQLCRFSRPVLQALIGDVPALETRLLQTACGELADAHQQMLLLGRMTARERIASFLLNRRGANALSQASVHLPMTRTDIGDHLGLTIETVSRTLSTFRRDRRIQIPSVSEIVILDPGWLTALAAGLG